MEPSNRDESTYQALGPSDRILEYQQQLVHSPHEDETTERTGLLWKHHSDGSTSDTLHEADFDNTTDMEAAHEYDMEHMPWLQRIVFCMTIRSGFLTMLPFWILISFLLMTLR